jgi:hypothetical protein
MENEHLILCISARGPFEGSCELDGVLLDPTRAADCPDVSWEGWTLGEDPRRLTVELATTTSLLAQPTAGGETDRGARDHRYRMIVNATQNIVSVRCTCDRALPDRPFLLSTRPTARPWLLHADIELLVDTHSQVPDFRAYADWLWKFSSVRYSGEALKAWNVKKIDLYKKTIEEAESLTLAAGTFLPFEVGGVTSGQLGVLRLGAVESGRCSAEVFATRDCTDLRPGTVLRRTVRWTNDRGPAESSGTLARVLALRPTGAGRIGRA